MNWYLKTASICLSILSAAAIAADYDVVINSGRVMDPESKFDAIRNVGIRDGRIATITEQPISGTETIDATGHVVAAGFIDYEQHGLDPWGIKVNLRDGVTTQMDFEVGALNIPEWYAKEKAQHKQTLARSQARNMLVCESMTQRWI